VPDEVGDAAVVAVLHRARIALLVLELGALVGQRDGQAAVEERHLLEAPGERLEVVGGGLEDLVVGPEGDGGAGLGGGPALVQVRGGGAAQVLLRPQRALGLDRDGQPGGQRVDHGDADTVQAAGDRVAAAAELAAGVQHGEHDLDGRLVLARHDADRDAAAVVHDANAAVGQQRDQDGVAVAGQGLVHGVVHDLVDQVVQAALAGGADVHAGALADRLEAFQDADRAGVVVAVVDLGRGGRGLGGGCRGGWVGGGGGGGGRCGVLGSDHGRETLSQRRRHRPAGEGAGATRRGPGARLRGTSGGPPSSAGAAETHRRPPEVTDCQERVPFYRFAGTRGGTRGLTALLS
jgi:hypothetical protein